MKATGIVRRIDELGRVVIPKEIRRTLHIREGAPLEIFTDRAGEIILKKYSPVGELSGDTRFIAEALNHALGVTACVCDRETVVSAAGSLRKELMDRPISEGLDHVIQQRRTLAAHQSGAQAMPVTGGPQPYQAAVVAPILSLGDPVGAVLLIQEGGRESDAHQQAMAELAADFLGRQMET